MTIQGGKVVDHANLPESVEGNIYCKIKQLVRIASPYCLESSIKEL
jgi:hypothetical protein